MFDRFYCIKSFCYLKTWEKMLRKTGFLLYNNGQQKHERCIGFKNASFRAKTYAILVSRSLLTSMHVNVDEVNFYDGPDCVCIKSK